MGCCVPNAYVVSSCWFPELFLAPVIIFVPFISLFEDSGFSLDANALTVVDAISQVQAAPVQHAHSQSR
jgi:hypothetical protein